MNIQIQPIGRVAHLADAVLRPFMYLLAGTFREAPQETHRWNNVRLADADAAQLDSTLMVSAQGDETATARWAMGIIPLMHMPVFGGWRDYLVLEPTYHQGTWYIGWIPDDGVPGLSLVPTTGGVRVLKGPGHASWFGVTEQGGQILLTLVGEGRIGTSGPHAHLPLR